MVKVIEDDRIQFESTGRVMYAFGPVVGLSCDPADGLAYYGWDGELAKFEPGLTQSERQELAAYMIKRWKAYGEAAS